MKTALVCMTLGLCMILACGCSYREDFEEPSPQEVQEAHSVILGMSDLEIIKKSADYLKAHGEQVRFEESQITFLHTDQKISFSINSGENEVFYQGDYLEVRLYPAPEPQEDSPDCTIIYLNDKGRVLGYSKNKQS